MKKLLIFTFALGFILATLAVIADAGGATAKRKRVEPKKVASSQNQSLIELVRRAQEAAEGAQAESRQAREQIEALQREVTSLRQSLAQLARSQPAQSEQFSRAEAAAKPAQAEPVLTDANPQPAQAEPLPAANAQSAIEDRQSDIQNPEDRLARVEEQVEINSAQIKEQAQSKVESDSRFRVRLFGMILANTYLNSNDNSLRDVPLYADPGEPGDRKNNFGATLRQSKIGLSLTGPHIGSARLSAEIETDFWGGVPGASESNVLGLIRIRTASAHLDWDRTSLEIGQRGPIISPREPNSLASVWKSPLADAGNLWQWRPQIVVEHRPALGEKTELVLQSAFMPSFGERVAGTVLEGPPAYESRIAFRRKYDAERNLEIGFGGHFGKREFGLGRNVDSYIIASDWLIPLGSIFGISGEAYHGRSVSLSEESGARIDRIFAFSGPLADPLTTVRGVMSSGGWIQLSARARSNLELNFAYGQEDPSNADILSGINNDYMRLKNQVGSANFIYHMRSNFLMSFEYRRLLTDYSTGRYKNNHYNLSFAYLF
ncbi:MAG: hypothetical protein J2P41_04190 [Blastocatellia bacterium]|nr:hypothetical protein [Blastocatellia bacterium]